MSTNNKKILSFLLCFILLFSIVPVDVLAAGENAPKVEEAKTIEFEVKEDPENSNNNIILFTPVSDEEDAEIEAAYKEAMLKRSLRSRVTRSTTSSIDYESYVTEVRVQLETIPTIERGFPWDLIFPDGADLTLKSYDNTTLVAQQTVKVNGPGLVVFPEKMRVYNNSGKKYEFGLSIPKEADINPIIEQIYGAGNYNDGTKVLTMKADFVQLVSTKFTTEWHSTKAEETFPALKGIFMPGQGEYSFNLPKNGEFTIIRNDNGDQKIVSTDILNIPQAPLSIFKMGIEGAGMTSGKVQGYFYETVYDKLEGGIFKFYEIKILTLDAGDGTVTPNEIEVGYTKAAGELPVPTPPEGKTFKRWKYADGKTFDPAAPVLESQNIIAEYIGDIIGPVDPKDPTEPEKPDDYVTVTYLGGDHGTVAPKNTYYVNPTKNVRFGDLIPPAVTPNTGYKHNGWDVADNFAIKADTTATAQYTKLDDLIGPFDPEGPNVPEKPDGYVTLTYSAGENGTIAKENTYYVNPEAGLTFGSIQAPEVIANTGFKFKGWDVADNFVIKADTTATAQYDAFDDVIGPFDPEDPYKPEKPDGYVTVTYLGGEHGKVADKNSYYVNPTKNITFGSLTAPGLTVNTGYKFDKWDVADNFVITADTTATAQYTKLDDVIGPFDPDNPPEKPDGYVQVTYLGGEHGTVAKESSYFVNPEANVTFGSLKAPAVTANVGYKHIGWDVAADFVIKADTIATALYEGIEDVIGPVDPEDPDKPEKPDGYVTVTYLGGEHGTVAKENTYYVNPSKNITFGSLTAPELTVNTGYKFDKWDVSDNFVITEDTTATAQYTKLDDVIGPFDPDNPPEKPDGYVQVTYLGGEHGTVAKESSYFVNPEANITFGSLEAPAVTPNTGYKHTGWNVAADLVIKADTTATALYEGIPDVVGPFDPENPPEKPDGYVQVTYLGGEHGTVAKESSYYVNPNAGINFGSLTPPELTVDQGYEFTGWDVDDNLVIVEDVTATAQYRESEFNPGKVVKMEITKAPDKVVYTEEEFFDPTGMEVTLTDINGKTKVVPYDEFAQNNLTVPTNKPLEVSDTAVTVTYLGVVPSLSADQPITVNPMELSAKPVNLKQEYVNERQIITGSFENGEQPDPATSEVILVDVNGNPILGSDGQPIKGVINPDGTFEFPIDDLHHNQQVKVQLTEEGKRPTISDETLTIDKKGPVIDNVKAVSSEDFIDLKAKVDEPDADVVIKIGDQTFPAVVDGEGNISATLPKNVEGDIVIVATDNLGNTTEKKVDKPAYQQLPLDLRGKRPYAGNFTFTAYATSGTKIIVELLRDGEVIDSQEETVKSGRATVFFGYELEVGDIVRLSGYYGTVYSEPIVYNII